MRTPQNQFKWATAIKRLKARGVENPTTETIETEYLKLAGVFTETPDVPQSLEENGLVEPQKPKKRGRPKKNEELA